jgi:hypothetical protein
MFDLTTESGRRITRMGDSLALIGPAKSTGLACGISQKSYNRTPIQDLGCSAKCASQLQGDQMTKIPSTRQLIEQVFLYLLR